MGDHSEEEALKKIQHEWAQKGKQDLLGEKFFWTDTFVKQGGQWKVVASQITPVLEK